MLQHNLRERVKELTCLHGVAQLMTKPGINVEEAFNGVIYLIKNAWQYPEITCARIIFSGKEFKMDNFRLTEWKQSSDIKSNGKTIGTLEVYYLEEKPETYEGPFLGEERALIEGIAQELGNFAERKEMEEELRNSGEKYRAIFHEARDGIALFDGNKGYIVDCNPEFEKQTGRRLKQLKKMRIWDIRPSEMREAGKEAFYTGRSKGKGRCPELEFQKPNGEIVYLECVGKRIKVRSRDYIQCITRDVTERKRAEERLRESKAFAENLIASMKDGFSVLDNKGVHLNVNEALCQMTGFTREELIGVGPPHPYWPEERYEEIQKAFQKTLKGEFEDFELIFKRKNGERFPVIVSPSCLRQEEGNVISYFATIKDITERKRAGEALRASRDYLERLTNSMWDAVFSVKMPGRVIEWANDSFRLIGYEPEECVGRTTEFLYPDKGEFLGFSNKLKNVIAAGKDVLHAEQLLKRKSGEVFPAEITTTIFKEKGEVVHITNIVRDITERRRVEQELREYQSGLEMLVKKRTAELQEQIGQRITYTRALVHELKTPLTPLVAASDFLVSKIRDEPLLSFAKIINTGALNLSSRIDELLDLARGEVGMLGLRYRPVEFLPLLEDTVNYVTPEVSVNGQSLILDTPACLPIVWSDEERIRQVLLNLLDNAFKFTPKGGRITLKAREKDAGIIIGVGDNGCGIDEEEKKHLFEPYRRLESNGAHLSGLGLGLSLSKMLIELHGGHISVTSQKGKGSTFSFWLPLKPTGQEKRKTEKEKGHEGSYY